MADFSEPNRKVAARWLSWVTDGAREGDLVAGWDGAEPYRRAFPLESPSAVDDAALVVSALGLYVALPIFVDGQSGRLSDVLRAHVAGCRFIDRDGWDLAQLDHPPDRAVALGHFTFGFWELTEPIDGDELTALQIELRDTLGGDPSWSASPLELFPLGGIRYSTDGEDVEAGELKVRAS